jgi:hypothetical protein
MYTPLAPHLLNLGAKARLKWECMAPGDWLRNDYSCSENSEPTFSARDFHSVNLKAVSLEQVYTEAFRSLEF